MVIKIHTHPTDVTDFPLFSLKDLESLAEIYANTTNENLGEVTILLICNIKGVSNTYALTIENFYNLQNAINNTLATVNNDREKIKRSIANTGHGYVDKELAFLQYFKYFGVNLFKANADLTSWEQRKLKKGSATSTNLNGTVEGVICN